MKDAGVEIAMVLYHKSCRLESNSTKHERKKRVLEADSDDAPV